MAIVLSLILHVVLSIVSGLDADDWRKKNRKTVIIARGIKCSSSGRKKNLRSIVSEIQRENTLLKRDLQCFRYI